MHCTKIKPDRNSVNAKKKNDNKRKSHKAALCGSAPPLDNFKYKEV